jgi:leucyl-tRNA synthetase
MFGADPLRLSVLGTAELLQDAEFSPAIAKSMHERLERLRRFAVEVAKTPRRRDESKKMLKDIDKWMQSRLQEHINKATENMDKLAVRKAIHNILYDLDQDLQWYQRRIKDQKARAKRKSIIAYIYNEVLDAQLRMLAPFAPHMSEELWEMTGRKGFASLSTWPRLDESKVDIKAEESEALVMSVMEDTLNIIKATGIAPKKIYYYTASPWKWKTYLNVLEKSVSAKVVPGNLIRELLKDTDLKAMAKEVAEFAGKIVDEANRIPEEKKQRLIQVGSMNEDKILKEIEDFFKRELKADIHIYNEEHAKCYDPKKRARTAKPYRPAIYVE